MKMCIPSFDRSTIFFSLLVLMLSSCGGGRKIVKVHTDPPDSEVYFDGYPATSDSEAVKSAPLLEAVDKHSVIVQKKGYPPEMIDLDKDSFSVSLDKRKSSDTGYIPVPFRSDLARIEARSGKQNFGPLGHYVKSSDTALFLYEQTGKDEGAITRLHRESLDLLSEHTFDFKHEDWYRFVYDHNDRLWSFVLSSEKEGIERWILSGHSIGKGATERSVSYEIGSLSLANWGESENVHRSRSSNGKRIGALSVQSKEDSSTPSVRLTYWHFKKKNPSNVKKNRTVLPFSYERVEYLEFGLDNRGNALVSLNLEKFEDGVDRKGKKDPGAYSILIPSRGGAAAMNALSKKLGQDISVIDHQWGVGQEGPRIIGTYKDTAKGADSAWGIGSKGAFCMTWDKKEKKLLSSHQRFRKELVLSGLSESDKERISKGIKEKKLGFDPIVKETQGFPEGGLLVVLGLQWTVSPEADNIGRALSAMGGGSSSISYRYSATAFKNTGMNTNMGTAGGMVQTSTMGGGGGGANYPELRMQNFLLIKYGEGGGSSWERKVQRIQPYLKATHVKPTAEARQGVFPISDPDKDQVHLLYNSMMVEDNEHLKQYNTRILTVGGDGTSHRQNLLANGEETPWVEKASHIKDHESYPIAIYPMGEHVGSPMLPQRMNGRQWILQGYDAHNNRQVYLLKLLR